MVYSGKEVDTRDILKDDLTRQYARLVQEIHTKIMREKKKEKTTTTTKTMRANSKF